MKKKINGIMFKCMLLTLACFFICQKPIQASAKERATMHSENVMYSMETDTGVSELDDAGDRGMKILVGLSKTLGGALGIIGIILGFIGFFGHQDDMKARAPIFLFVGVGIFFANEIFSFLVGK